MYVCISVDLALSFPLDGACPFCLTLKNFTLTFRGKGAAQKKVEALRALRRLLSKSEIPPVKAALQAGAVPLLVQCLSFGSPDEQVCFLQ